MDRPELITRLAALNPQLKTKDAELAVKVMLDALCGNLEKGGRVEIRGFGSFSLSLIQPRQKRDLKVGGKSPKAGDKIKVPVKYVPQFKPAKELRERVGDSAEAQMDAGIQAAKIHPPLPTMQSQLNPVVVRNMEAMINHV
jgi:integration host factor subunit beta